VKKLWLVASATYRRRVRSGTFLFLTFGLPVLMIIAGSIPFIRNSGALPAVGYVDQTGQLAPVTQVAVGTATLHLISYAGTGAAREALLRDDIAGYLVIPQGYLEGQDAVFYGKEEPSDTLQEGLKLFIQHAMLPDAPAYVLERLANPAVVTYVAQDTGERVRQGPALLVQIGTPIVLALIFALAVFTGAGQMGAAVVREKDQRAMEMVVTSLRPSELVAGKVLGMALLTLTQVGIWTVGAGAAIFLALSSSTGLQGLNVPWEALIWAGLLGVPGYFMYAVIAAGLGVIAGDGQQARQLAGLLGMLGMAPLYFLGLLINALDSPIAIALTLFPLTAPMMALFRMALTTVPAWELAASLALILVALAASTWFVARIFRAAMLMYGQALRPREILSALRQA
jgi:ABC-2 type transport system permease protein